MNSKMVLGLALYIVTSVDFCGLANAAAIGGPAHKSGTDSCCFWSSFIEPDTAMLVPAAGTDYLANGLDVAGFTAPDWEIDYRQLSGSLTVTAYYAWVTDELTGATFPTPDCGGLTAQDFDPTRGRRSGAVFCLEYSPADGDPTGDDNVHWIQAVKTDFDPGAVFAVPPGAAIFNAPDRTFHFLDNGWSSETPYYDAAHGAASSTHFLDVPYQVCATSPTMPIASGGSVEFSVFVAGFEDRPNGKVAAIIYSDGYRWGYNFSCSPLIAMPGPSTSALVIWGTAGLFLCAWRARRNLHLERNTREDSEH